MLFSVTIACNRKFLIAISSRGPPKLHYIRKEKKIDVSCFSKKSNIFINGNPLSLRKKCHVTNTSTAPKTCNCKLNVLESNETKYDQELI